MGLRAASGRLVAAVGTVLVTVAVAAGCAAGSAAPAESAPNTVDPAPVVLQAATLSLDQPVPAPTGAPALTVTGRIGVLNSGSGLSFDQATLDGLGRVRITVYEPWVKQTVNFQGVWLSDLLAHAHVDPAATSVHITALDDYQIDLPLADVMAGGVLLVTRSGDGAPIPIQDGGPTRIVFTGGVPSAASADMWIWSLSTIDVR